MDEPIKKKYKTTTSSAVKRKYNNSHYEIINVSVPIGTKDKLKAILKVEHENGIIEKDSLNGFINRLIEAKINEK